MKGSMKTGTKTKRTILLPNQPARAALVRRLMRNRGCDISDLALASNLHHETVRRYAALGNGPHTIDPRTETTRRIFKALHVELWLKEQL